MFLNFGDDAVEFENIRNLNIFELDVGVLKYHAQRTHFVLIHRERFVIGLSG